MSDHASIVFEHDICSLKTQISSFFVYDPESYADRTRETLVHIIYVANFHRVIIES